jgi:hypothetical protein
VSLSRTQSDRNERLEHLRFELEELLRSRPAHSLSTSMAVRLEELEEEIADLERDAENVTGSN